MSVESRIREVMKNPPLKFQIQGVRFMEEHDGRILLGDSMGLGKTYQSIAWIMLHPEASPVIIVCPSIMKYIWQEELLKHAGLESEVVQGRKPYHPQEDIVILNYEILSYWVGSILAGKPKLLIVDESHYIKNPKAQRTKACKKMAGTPHILALSGTPMINRPAELFPILQILRPSTFNSFWNYAFRYCDPKPGWRGRGWDFTGASNLEELHEKLSTVMIRRMKREVLKELPPKRKSVLPVDIDNRRDYEAASEDFIGWLHEKYSAEKAERAAGAIALVRLGTLKRLVTEGKMKSIHQWIKSFLEETNQKLVVYAIHRSIIQKLKEKYPDALIIDGSVGSKKRQQIVEQFQTDPNRRLIINNIKAGGIGITLTASSTVLFVEIGWTPSEHAQAEDRVLRIGQEAESVNIYYMIGKDTIEERILEIIEKKQNICDTVLDGKGITTKSIFSLFRKRKS